MAASDRPFQTTSTRRWTRSICSLSGLAGLGVMLAACGRDPAPAPAAPPAAAPSKTAAPAPAPTPQDAVDPITQVFGEAPPPVTVHFTLRELPFEEHSEGLPKTGTWRGYPLLYDFNGDGLADLVASNREEDGYSAFEASKTGAWKQRIEGLDRTMAYGPARAADMNSDGIPDLVLSAHSDALRIYLNDGHMNWKLASRLAHDDNAFLMLDIATGNLDGDAFPDVVGIGNFDGGLQVFLGDGKASEVEGHPGLRHLPESRTLIPPKTLGKLVALADLDGDGIDDIVVATNGLTQNNGLKAFLTRKGTPMRWEDVSAGLPVPTIGNSFYGLAVGRFVAGGWPQIAACSLNDPTSKAPDDIGVYAWDPASKSWGHVDSGLDRKGSYRDLVAGDLDKDGNLDLVVMSLNDGGMVLRGDGKGKFEAVGRLAGVDGAGFVRLGDIDGDGWLDIVVVHAAEKNHPEEGSIRALLNRPAVWKKD
jgi:hypothetical protein